MHMCLRAAVFVHTQFRFGQFSFHFFFFISSKYIVRVQMKCKTLEHLLHTVHCTLHIKLLLFGARCSVFDVRYYQREVFKEYAILFHGIWMCSLNEKDEVGSLCECRIEKH